MTHSNRDSGIEFARIIACLMVIGVHVYDLNHAQDWGYDFSRIFISCIIADGVAIFWLITGCFFFDNTNYVRLVRKTFIHVGIWVIFLNVLLYYFGDWIIYGQNFIESVSHTKNDYVEFFKSILRWKEPISDLGQLWYLFAYFLVILFFPVLKSFVDYLDENKKCELVFIIISLVILLINDVTHNGLCEFSHHSINAAFPAAIEIVWRHILYKYRNKLNRSGGIFVSFLMFLVLNIFRGFIMLTRYNAGETSICILYWYSIFGLLCAISIVVFSMNFISTINSRTVSNIVNWVASLTLGVYLIHFPLIRFLDERFGLRHRLWTYISSKYGETALADVTYTLLLIFLIAVISFLIVSLWRSMRYVKQHIRGFCFRK